MFEIELLDDMLDDLNLPIDEGFESTIFMTDGYNYTKIFKHYIPVETLSKKEQVLIALHFSRLSNRSREIIPEVYRLIHQKNGAFIGYSMVELPGKGINEFCENIPISDKLSVFKNLEETIKTVHDNGFYLTDFNPGNILVYKDFSIRFVDIDSFCFENDSTKNLFFNYRYVCSFSKVIDKKFNIYSFYALMLDVLLNVNKTDNSKKEILHKISLDKELPDHIKEKLVYFVKVRNKKQLAGLDYMF